MKTLVVSFVSGLLLLAGVTHARQNVQAEVPGDNFSLEGALELFKKSASPEEFERLLNSEGSKVNNLDLNGDGLIDYVKVIAKQEGNVNIFILQAVVSKNERQDIAVIELEKLADGKAVLQIVGDADIYGIETIIEPTTEVRVNAGTTTTHTVVNVWAWPSVQYIYGPSYSVWVSPWAWTYYPRWWSPWRPVAYVTYHPYWYSYRPYYRICHTPRIVYAHQRMYRPVRTTSVVVYNRHQHEISRYRSAPQHSRNNRTGYVASTRSYRDDVTVNRPSRERGTVTNSPNTPSHNRRLSSSNPSSERSITRERSAATPRDFSSETHKRTNERSTEVRSRESGRTEQRNEPTARPQRQSSSNESRERAPSRSYERSGSQRQPAVQQRSGTTGQKSVSPRGNSSNSVPKSGGSSRSRGRD